MIYFIFLKQVYRWKVVESYNVSVIVGSIFLYYYLR